MQAPDLTRATSLRQEVQGPEAPGAAGRLLHGPTANEGQDHYQVGMGAHTLVVLGKVSPDAMLAHQVRVTAFYHRASVTPVLQAVPREVRELILRCEMPVASQWAPSGTRPDAGMLLFGAAGSPLYATGAVAEDVAIAEADESFGYGSFGTIEFGG